MNNVVLYRTSGSQESINQTLSEIFTKLEVPDVAERVVIKPNLCYYWKASTGYTTDPRIVAGIIDVLRSKYGQDITINIAEADATGMRVKHAYTMLDYRKLAEEKNVNLVNLSEGDSEKKEATINGKKIKFKISREITNSDLLINVPKMKIMRETHITGEIYLLHRSFSPMQRGRIYL